MTTFVTIFVLFIMGVPSIKEFALPIIIGLIAGAYSSVFITGSLWYVFKTKVGKNRIVDKEPEVKKAAAKEVAAEVAVAGAAAEVKAKAETAPKVENEIASGGVKKTNNPLSSQPRGKKKKK